MASTEENHEKPCQDSSLLGCYVLSTGSGVKVKFTRKQATKAQSGSIGITISLTSTLDGVGGQLHAPAALPPVKTRYQL